MRNPKKRRWKRQSLKKEKKHKVIMKSFSYFKLGLLIFSVLIFVSVSGLAFSGKEAGFFVFAESDQGQVSASKTLADETDSSAADSPDGESAAEYERKVLEEELGRLEEQITKYEGDITKTQQEKKTLQNQIDILKNRISKLNLQIQQSGIMIKDVGLQIKDTEKSIEKTSTKIEDYKAQLGGILRSVYEQDQKSLIEILFSEKTISDFFDNLVNLEILNSKNQELLKEIKNLKVSLEDQRGSLDDEKSDLEKILTMQKLQVQDSASTKKEKDVLLEQTKGKESEYQKLLAETKKKAEEIRSRIFEMIGVSKAPTFGEALDIAKFVSGLTGVRPAFLLAILTQESNVGKNVGQCYLKDTETGSGVSIKTGAAVNNVMKPMGKSGRRGDIDDFLAITKELGRDPFATPVSCPIASVGGYGGAMGPAQFIPTTWSVYAGKVEEITGKSADPWDIRDSFLAAALYLKKYGADSKKSTDEWRAALIYFSGSTNTKYRFYGDSVLSIAEKYEQDIKDLEEVALSNKGN